MNEQDIVQNWLQTIAERNISDWLNFIYYKRLNRDKDSERMSKGDEERKGDSRCFMPREREREREREVEREKEPERAGETESSMNKKYVHVGNYR